MISGPMSRRHPKIVTSQNSPLRLRKAQPRWSNIIGHLQFINSVRAMYPSSSKIYTINDLNDVYLVQWHGQCAGYIEAQLINDDLMMETLISVFIEDFHIHPNFQKKGVGKCVFDFLLAKGFSLEMVVAKTNVGMNNLLSKFQCVRQPSVNTDTVLVYK